MKQLEGSHCKIHVLVNDVDLYYNALVIGVSNTHILFKDKHGETYSFRLIDVIQITKAGGCKESD